MTKVNFRDSILCATRGLFRGISSERNIKIQILIGGIIILFAMLLEISKVYLITIIIVCFLVVILELFNRGFEKLIDLVSPEYNREFGKVKDAMAGVVLLTFTMAILVSSLILFEPVINFLERTTENNFFIFAILGNVILILVILLANYLKNHQP